jgi:hypothetical protein
MTLERTVVACKDQVSADLSDEVVILSLRNGEYFGLNSVGAEIWALIQQPMSVDDVRDHLLRAYPDVEPERCTREVVALIDQMIEAGLVEAVASQGS